MSSEPVPPDPGPPAPPEPQPMVFKCQACGAQPVALTAAKWRHPAGIPNEDNHEVIPVKVA